MNNGILGNALTEVVMEKVVRDKIKAQLKGDAPPSQQQQEKQNQQNQMNDNEDDPDFDDNDEEMLKIMNKMKMQKLKETNQKQNQSQEIGEYREIIESEFLNYVTKNEFAVVHFYHKDFERCKIVDNHLRMISQYHPECKFLYLNAEKAPFFVTKLAIQVLPTIVCFIKGVAKDKVIGFQDFNSKDDFATIEMTRRLVQAGVIQPRNNSEKQFNLNFGDKKQDNEGSDDEY